MGVVVSRFDVFLVNLDPTVGSEIRTTRPCVIVSPDETWCAFSGRHHG
jgi:mRNA interferase MazF